VVARSAAPSVLGVVVSAVRSSVLRGFVLRSSSRSSSGAVLVVAFASVPVALRFARAWGPRVPCGFCAVRPVAGPGGCGFGVSVPVALPSAFLAGVAGAGPLAVSAGPAASPWGVLSGLGVGAC
jgi:hypothetical protein